MKTFKLIKNSHVEIIATLDFDTKELLTECINEVRNWVAAQSEGYVYLEYSDVLGPTINFSTSDPHWTAKVVDGHFIEIYHRVYNISIPEMGKDIREINPTNDLVDNPGLCKKPHEWDLYLYNKEVGCYIGPNGEVIRKPKDGMPEGFAWDSEWNDFTNKDRTIVLR